jgi:hypothetical protein
MRNGSNFSNPKRASNCAEALRLFHFYGERPNSGFLVRSWAERLRLVQLGGPRRLTPLARTLADLLPNCNLRLWHRLPAVYTPIALTGGGQT